MDKVVEKTAVDYAKYLDVNLPSKFQPLQTSIDEILARLEEFQTMLSFIAGDRKDYNDIIASIPNYKPRFDDMFKRIDVLEVLVAHMKDNMDTLESNIEKAEAELGINEPAMKVPSIFTPLFKKSTSSERSPSKGMEIFHTEDYFK
ncbi:unnamed protein product [Acanthoscelides obtectus]|uniref:Biogenesis of lysosome-related organelles complex 1 subunit 4 n=1 Tax=Acanthoscelides obtectus TaxID=200917 RepID=A0A9P0PFT0_ACAOB|nr:unnamed protein product [Acanthoscelides obtectus]CAK1634458.1 Biogenesis of lysosome-related organelles complex 1 subunit 4 [Acanthoscelides obtectus]